MGSLPFTSSQVWTGRFSGRGTSKVTPGENEKVTPEEEERPGWHMILGRQIDGYAEYLDARRAASGAAIEGASIESSGLTDTPTVSSSLKLGQAAQQALPPIGKARVSWGGLNKRSNPVAVMGGEFKPRSERKMPTNFLDLMMWAVLAGEPALATELWGRTREPLRAAILASCVCKTLATYDDLRH